MSGKTDNGNVNGIKRLHGSLCLIDRNLIKFADGKDEKELKHFNLRFAAEKAEGTSEEDMSNLRESIQEQGLLHPLQVAHLPSGKLVLVGGERRKRSIDKLVSDNTKCWDPASKKHVPAADLYSSIECRLFDNCDHESALRLTVDENLYVPIGDAAAAESVRHLIKHGKTDEQIAKEMRKPKQWVDRIKTIIGLDKETYAAFCKGKINQSVALELAEMKQEDRKACLVKAIEIANERKTSALKKSIAECELEEEATLAKLDLAEAEGDKKALVEASAKAEEIAKKIETKKKKVSSTKSKANNSDLRLAKQAIGKDDDAEDKQLTTPKLITHWYKPIKDLVNASDDLNPDNPALEEEGVPLALARFVRYLFEEGINKGERNIKKLLQRYDDEI
jgi:hypothetical protein